MTFIAVYVPEFHLPRWILIAIAVAAFLFAPARLYSRQAEQIARLELNLQEFRQARARAALAEEPNVSLSVRWPDDNPANKPMQFIATNRGKLPLTSFQMQTLTLDFFHVSFSNIPSLEPGVAQQVEYKISGASGDEVDLLDILMVAQSNISPGEYPLRAQVTKANDETCQMRYKLSYAPLHNPRKTGGASEFELCILIERS
jgi:hypothetical protein